MAKTSTRPDAHASTHPSICRAAQPIQLPASAPAHPAPSPSRSLSMSTSLSSCLSCRAPQGTDTPARHSALNSGAWNLSESHSACWVFSLAFCSMTASVLSGGKFAFGSKVREGPARRTRRACISLPRRLPCGLHSVRPSLTNNGAMVTCVRHRFGIDSGSHGAVVAAGDVRRLPILQSPQPFCIKPEAIASRHGGLSPLGG